MSFKFPKSNLFYITTVFYFQSSKKIYFLNRFLVYIYLPKASKYLYISLHISIVLPRARNSLYISVTIDFQIAISWYVFYSISLSPQVYVQIQSNNPPPFILHIKSYALLQCNSSTYRVMSPTAVLYHMNSYVPYYCVKPPHKELFTLM